jgi:carbonic anhydrase
LVIKVESVLVSCVAILIAGSGLQAGEDPHWSYSGTTGPENWGELSPDYAACRVGVNQSPINISDTFPSELGALEPDYRSGSTTIVNNGHTLQVNAEPGSSLQVEGQSFELLQLHYHSPSEHQINGEQFLLEAHFVHQNENGELAVVAVLFRDGAWNSGLEKIGKAAPVTVGQSAPIDIRFEELTLHASHESYFRYNGSLTTPPCTEGIRWYVLKTSGTISAVQAARFVDLIGEDSRGPQPLNARIILEHY